MEHLDWREVLDRYDGPSACFYLDPPYHPEARGRERHSSYVHELETPDHEDLVAAAIELEGSVLISGYDHPSYAPLEAAGFERLEFDHQTTASRIPSGRGPRTEVVWRRLERGVYQPLQMFALAAG